MKLFISKAENVVYLLSLIPRTSFKFDNEVLAGPSFLVINDHSHHGILRGIKLICTRLKVDSILRF